ncbi:MULTISPECIES: hypothetical protein [unclassified Mesorhizobium]|uniref:hypothetical protein n=1 Tax=unclassified Mesorhizobium TaxID=325217 RepID=UPI0018DE2573|nr:MULTISPECIES: hypothetical protein [unclassified Mesorhizobium]WJI78351.1 hypothetical protein NLY37_08780 [Mesorhizobium sp. C395A]
MATIMHSAPRMFGERGKGVTGLQEQFQKSVKRFSVRNCVKTKNKAVRRFGETVNRPSL